MARWEPNARGRLQEAALALYGERGFERVTVAEIAQRAGLTERTYFRYFADKREVLFWGSAMLQDRMVNAITTAPDSAPPIDLVALALSATGEIFQDRRDHARRRTAVINANPELLERELIKLARLSDALAEVLRDRGIPDTTATLTGQLAVTVFHVAFQRWISDNGPADMTKAAEEVLADLKKLTT